MRNSQEKKVIDFRTRA